jgi:hypothetical protein
MIDIEDLKLCKSLHALKDAKGLNGALVWPALTLSFSLRQVANSGAAPRLA